MLDAREVEYFIQDINSNWSSVVDASSLETILDAYWTNTLRSKVYKEVLNTYKRTQVSEASRVTDINITNGGTGYSKDEQITVTGDGSGAYILVTDVNNGVIATTTINDGGTGYTTATADLTEIGDGNATATLTLDTGVITAVTITNGGTGYSVGDVITVTGDGADASIEVATVSNGIISSANVLFGGSGYTTATADLTGIGNGDATATLVVDIGITAVDEFLATL